MKHFLLCACVVLGVQGSQLRAAPNPEPDSKDALAALQPVLAKLRGLDPKTFNLLNGMLGNVAHGSQPSSFLQYVHDNPADAQDKLTALAPILSKLQALDPKAFAMLNGLVEKSKGVAPSQRASLLQDPPMQSGVDTAAKTQALAPVLDKLKGLDAKTYEIINGLISQVASEKH
mmetsp:Transcript_39999/g.106119  ORF Transcript_39999/g.106119 Transcript_39999/m.106119 type:complete len:174 (-) Transcript_39999:53-574(-)